MYVICFSMVIWNRHEVILHVIDYYWSWLISYTFLKSSKNKDNLLDDLNPDV